jgi:hypothetical protein
MMKKLKSLHPNLCNHTFLKIGVSYTWINIFNTPDTTVARRATGLLLVPLKRSSNQNVDSTPYVPVVALGDLYPIYSSLNILAWESSFSRAILDYFHYHYFFIFFVWLKLKSFVMWCKLCELLHIVAKCKKKEKQ